MSATSATFHRQALKSATETETAKLDLAVPLDSKPTRPGPGFVGYDAEGRFAPAASGVRLVTTSACERVGSARGIAESIGRKDMNHEFIHRPGGPTVSAPRLRPSAKQLSNKLKGIPSGKLPAAVLRIKALWRLQCCALAVFCSRGAGARRPPATWSKDGEQSRPDGEGL
jgi:hypothetical protein